MISAPNHIGPDHTSPKQHQLPPFTNVLPKVNNLMEMYSCVTLLNELPTHCVLLVVLQAFNVTISKQRLVQCVCLTLLSLVMFSGVTHIAMY